MKLLLVFEDSTDEPIEFFLAAVREVIARPPALIAEVTSMQGQNETEPVDRIIGACKQAFKVLQESDAERGAFFLPALIRDRAGGVVFRGQIVLFITKEHFLKISLVENADVRTQPIMQVFMNRIMPELAKEFSSDFMNDEDRSLVKLIIQKVTEGLNLATSRFSVHSGNA